MAYTKRHITERNGLIVDAVTDAEIAAQLADFSPVMTREEAMVVLQDAAKVCGSDLIKKALACFVEIYGWEKDEQLVRFVEFCSFRAAQRSIDYGSKAKNIARYMVRWAGDEIATARAYIAKKGNDISHAPLQSI